MKETNIYLSENLRYLRKLKGWTQTQMGAIAGAKWQRYQKWENGNCTPDYSKLIRYAHYFGFTLEQLLTTDISTKKVNISRPHQLYNHFEKAEKDTKKIVCALLNYKM